MSSSLLLNSNDGSVKVRVSCSHRLDSNISVTLVHSDSQSEPKFLNPYHFTSLTLQNAVFESLVHSLEELNQCTLLLFAEASLGITSVVMLHAAAPCAATC